MTLEYVGAGAKPASGPTPGIENWKAYVLGRWPGGIDLGTFAVRTIRGGSALSVHAMGRAWDWRYEDPGPGRATADQAIAFAIDHHETLGIQAVHDYVNCRIWRSSRPGTGPAWKQQQPGNGMGESWAKWLHFEVHPDAALHAATVEQIFAGAGREVPAGKSPASASASLPLPTLKEGDEGAAVTLLQEVLKFWHVYPSKVDGEFGPKTKAALKTWQQALQPLNAGPADGVYGPRTHAAAAASYASLSTLRAA